MSNIVGSLSLVFAAALVAGAFGYLRRFRREGEPTLGLASPLLEADPAAAGLAPPPPAGTGGESGRQARAALERSHRLTQVILAISARFAGLRLEEVNEAIQSALAEIGGFLGVDRVQLFRLHEDAPGFSVTHEWCAPGVPHHIDDLQKVGPEQYPWLWRTLEATGLVAADVDRLPEEASHERGWLASQGLISFACVAVHRHGRPVGFLGLDALSHRRAWPDDEISLLRVVADVLSNALARRRAEEALRDREEIFRSISAAAKDAIVMADPRGVVTVWNEAAQQMFGYTRDEAVGRPVHALIVPGRYEDRSVIGLAQFAESGRGPLIGPPQQIFARRKDGGELPVELSISAVQLRGGWHAVAIIRDITERLKVEEALWGAKEQAEAANQELQRSVERANRLADEAAVANAAKSEFLANMSHEIRTPMNGIIGMSGLLLDTPLTPEQREYVETVRSCADSLLTIINDILDFSKMEAGRLQLEVLDFDLAVTIEETSDVLAVRANEKNLELTCLVPPKIPRYLCGDPGRLRQVLTNLVGNAVKFTPAGQVNIEVRLEEERDEAVVLRFLVKDTGIGIPPEKLPLLFQPFTQVDSSMTRRFGGTGLGLSISRQLTELMGGTIGVESEVGRGSTFWFTARFGRQRRPAPPPLPADIAGVKVLGADDNAVNRRVLEGMLASWGCRYEMAQDGPSALARLREAAAAGDPFRVAILDMMMPGMTGDEVGRLVKQDALLRGTVLLMMTSIGRRGDAARLAGLGFAGYLTKPVKGSHLFEALRMVVGGAGDTRVQSSGIVTRYSVAEAAAQRRVRILLAEDNITNQRVAVALLEKMGHRVDAVANGAEALRALATMPYDLVLMDVQMPEMDGFEATRAIRGGAGSVRNPSVPIVAMTAHAMKGDRERCLAAGMDDYVAKPIRRDELAAAIRRWTSHDRRRGGATAGEMEKDRANHSEPPAHGEREVDRHVLLERLGGDESILEEIVKVFLEDTPGQVQAMVAAAEADDRKTLRRLAHSLKGSAGTVGATALQQAAAALEQAVDGGDMTAVGPLIASVRAHYASVERIMSGWGGRQEQA